MSYLEDVIYDDPEFYSGYWLVEERLRLGQRGKWETRKGEVLKIKEMDSSHIRNVIRMLKRSEFSDDYFTLIQKFEHELILREK